MESEKPDLISPKDPSQEDKNPEVVNNPNIETPPPKPEGEAPSAEKTPSDLPAHPKISKKLAMWAAGVLLVVIAGAALVMGLNRTLFNVTSLHFVPEDAEFYLGISVRDHPQVQKLKELSNKFPGGEELAKAPNMFSSELFGAPKDPFEDIVRLAEKEIFLAKMSTDETNASNTVGRTSTATRGSGLETLVNIVDLKSSGKAGEKLENFKEDKAIYTTSTQTFEGKEILDIKLKQQGRTSERYPIGSLPLGVTLPYSQSVYASSVDKFILSSEKLADLKKALTHSKTASMFSFLTNRGVKNILSDKEHKEISKNFPKDYLIKFYQQKPLEPFSNLIPISSISQSFLLSYDSLDRIEGKNYIEVSRGLAITAHDDGVRMDSYQIDWRTPKEELKNPYKISESLASKLPQKYSGITPLIFSETKNFKQLMSDQEEILKDVAEQSDNRNQRKDFENAVDGFKKFKVNLRKTFGVDPDKDIFSWMSGNIATIINAGGKNKAPESLVVAEIKNQKEVEESLKKIKLPNYVEQNKQTTTKRLQESNIRSIGSALLAHYTANNEYPKTLNELKNVYIYRMPKDAITGKPYKYIVTSNQQAAKVSGKLPDGRTVYFSTDSGYLAYSGTVKETTIPPLKPRKSTYKNVNLYSVSVYDQSYLKYSMYFAVTKNKAIVLFGDGNQSIKDIIDFEQKPDNPLSARNGWKDQFGDISSEVGGLIYMEPVALFGLWEYYSNLYSDTIGLFLSSESDLETVMRAYLATMESIGTVVTKEKPVYATKSFVRIKELPKEEKEKAEEALFRLTNPTGSRSILGVQDTNWTEVFKGIKESILP
jgi:hypothetical protein